MRDLQQILSDASLLSQQDLRQLIYALEELTETPGAESIPSAPYTRSLAAAGSAAGAFSDVSADKYKHLAEAYTSTDNHP